MKINHDLRHKISAVEAQGKALIEQKVELEAGAQTRGQEVGALRQEVARLRERLKGDIREAPPQPPSPAEVIRTFLTPMPRNQCLHLRHGGRISSNETIYGNEDSHIFIPYEFEELRSVYVVFPRMKASCLDCELRGLVANDARLLISVIGKSTQLSFTRQSP